jgi:hypothetical protein
LASGHDWIAFELEIIDWIVGAAECLVLVDYEHLRYHAGKYMRRISKLSANKEWKR